jgi:hypothetical protein
MNDDREVIDATIENSSIEECKLRGHDIRSIANDHRTGKNHAKHFQNELKRG